MRGMRSPGGMLAGLIVVGTLLLAGTSISAAAPLRSHAQVRTGRWAQEHVKGVHVFKHQVPLAVTSGTAKLLRPHRQSAKLTLNFSFPLRNSAALDRLIARQAKTHQHMSRSALYRRFSPSQAQVSALGVWLQARGFRITHVGRDRLTLSARASTATIERALGTRVADFRHPGTQLQG